MPPNTIYVGRGSIWENTYTIGALSRETVVKEYERWLDSKSDDFLLNFLKPLVGHDIACWCKVNELCHGDLLIEIIEELKLESRLTCEHLPIYSFLDKKFYCHHCGKEVQVKSE